MMNFFFHKLGHMISCNRLWQLPFTHKNKILNGLYTETSKGCNLWLQWWKSYNDNRTCCIVFVFDYPSVSMLDYQLKASRVKQNVPKFSRSILRSSILISLQVLELLLAIAQHNILIIRRKEDKYMW